MNRLTLTPPCQSDLACFRNDGHAGDHAYATPDTVPSPAPQWQAGYDAGYREAQEDIAAGVRVTGDAGLREALLNWFDTTHANGFGHDHHCPAPWSDEPYSQPIFDRCTCGWSDVQRADRARAALATGDVNSQADWITPSGPIDKDPMP